MRFKFRLLFLFAGISLFVFLMYDLRRGVKQMEIDESIGNTDGKKKVVDTNLNEDNLDFNENNSIDDSNDANPNVVDSDVIHPNTGTKENEEGFEEGEINVNDNEDEIKEEKEEINVNDNEGEVKEEKEEINVNDDKTEKEEELSVNDAEDEVKDEDEELESLMDKSKEPVDDLYMEIIQDGKKLDEKFVSEIREMKRYRGGPLEPEWKWIEDISIVYTWVNGSDLNHLDLKSKYNGGNRNIDNRDRSVDELRYSLRSFEKYLPWHKGTIYIVTPNQVPVWLNTDNPRIKVINQDDIIPEEGNPTFNSFLMEMYLDRIPGITERFVYLNDDYFFRSYTHPCFFFAEKNFAPKFYLGRKVPYGMDKAIEMNKEKDKLSMIRKFQSAVFYTNGIVKEAFGNSIYIRWLEHSPYSWYRDLFEPARQLFSKYIKQSLTHRFRDPLDLIPTYGFQAYVMYAAAVPNYPEYVGGDGTARESAPAKLNEDRTIEVYDFDIVSPNVRLKTIKFGSVFENLEKNKKLFNDIRNSTVLLYNLNDDYKSEKAGQCLVEFMKSMYPEPSNFELSDEDVQKRLENGFDGRIQSLEVNKDDNNDDNGEKNINNGKEEDFL